MNVSRRVKNTFDSANLTISPAVAQQERFLKGFAIGFLVASAGIAYGLTRGRFGDAAEIAGCALIGLVVGGGAILWDRYYPAKLRQ